MLAPVLLSPPNTFYPHKPKKQTLLPSPLYAQPRSAAELGSSLQEHANTRCWGLAATAPPARSAPPTAGLSSSATRTSSPSSASPPPPTAGFPSRPIKHLPSQPHRSKTGRTTNLASCIVATIFLLFLAAGIVVVYYFLLFKPKDPKITVDVVQFPTFSVANSIVDFTFLQYVTVSNPNTHYDRSRPPAYSDAPLELLSAGFTPRVLFTAPAAPCAMFAAPTAAPCAMFTAPCAAPVAMFAAPCAIVFTWSPVCNY
ncbi:hypothetical protein RJ640_021227 [Escallonia rubra]|uniref:Late embryogenesis abundant protein LEA-2 subgroup domain-containing protein n=1 Tax=Escallonia rubra TaxID=112253 RepID=A0AA88UA34_9ASTE|nr:hypothetical protein RJ640_021227 [Escallonia rubra]